MLTLFCSVSRGYQQHDAHEFMHYLLDRVHTELLQTKIYSNAKDTIVSGIFSGLLQSEVNVVIKLNMKFMYNRPHLQQLTMTQSVNGYLK